MTSHAAAERAALADALTAAGPDAPTLCTGWATRDMAAHLVLRENRPDVSVANVLPVLAGRAARIQAIWATTDYTRLVERFRSGPPLLSVFALPGADARLNLVEFLVHGEDVRRGRPGWQPRQLPAERQDAIWRALAGSAGRLFLRRSPVGVELVEPGGRRTRPMAREPLVTITGEPLELLLYVTGRREAALVGLDGPPGAVERLAGAKLEI